MVGLNGCNSAQPVVDAQQELKDEESKKDGTKESTSADDQQQVDTNNASKASDLADAEIPPPQLDANATNEDGQVVLGDPEAELTTDKDMADVTESGVTGSDVAKATSDTKDPLELSESGPPLASAVYVEQQPDAQASLAEATAESDFPTLGGEQTQSTADSISPAGPESPQDSAVAANSIRATNPAPIVDPRGVVNPAGSDAPVINTPTLALRPPAVIAESDEQETKAATGQDAGKPESSAFELNGPIPDSLSIESQPKSAPSRDSDSPSASGAELDPAGIEPIGSGGGSQSTGEAPAPIDDDESPTIGAGGAPSGGAPGIQSASAPGSLLASASESVVKQKKQPVEANVATEAERNQSIAEDWPEPQAVIFVSGQQYGYIEPCGCTGLETQKGGLIRRDTLLTQLRDRGWDVIPVDVGNQVRRIGRQPELKFQTTVEAFKMMDYKAATLGTEDLRLSSIELIQAASSDELNPGAFISANVSIIDPSFFPSYRIVESGGRKIGITAAMGEGFKSKIQTDEIEFFDPVEKLGQVVRELKAEGCDFLVLLAHASLEESASIAQAVPQFDLVVTAGGFGEPTLEPEKIDGTKSVMVQVGVKGMYGGIVGLFDDPQRPLRYQKLAISSQFKDSPRMLVKFAQYQKRLEEAGYSGLGLSPVQHATGRDFAGSETCGDCHTTAFEIWEDTPHYHATDSIVEPSNERGGVARHFDPECISCHVTGWKPQQFYPFKTGYLNLDESEHLLGSGCENCHGPGKRHSDAEYGDIEVDNETLLELREQMIIKLDQAHDKCLECHDLDNSPDFHAEGAFDEFWERVKHYGKD